MWVIARTKSKRPSLMHLVNPEDFTMTSCGIDISAWSRAYFQAPIPQVECLRCKKAQS